MHAKFFRTRYKVTRCEGISSDPVKMNPMRRIPDHGMIKDPRRSARKDVQARFHNKVDKWKGKKTELFPSSAGYDASARQQHAVSICATCHVHDVRTNQNIPTLHSTGCRSITYFEFATQARRLSWLRSWGLRTLSLVIDLFTGGTWPHLVWDITNSSVRGLRLARDRATAV